MSDASEQESLAGEYALGTLDAAERTRVAQERRASPALDAQITAWEQRLAPLLAPIPPITPPARLWHAIASATRTAPMENTERQLRFWRMAAACIAILFVGILAVPHFTPMSQPAESVVLLQKGTGAPTAFVVNIHPSSLTVLANDALPEKGSYELWVIVGKSAPRPLGVLSSARTELPFTRGQAEPKVLADAVFAISLEPKGGSPTGLPTGPVLFTGKALGL